MQVIENYLKTRYKLTTASQVDQDVLKSFMSHWLQSQINRKASEKNFLTKKAAQLFALVSLIDFPSRWATFFADLIVTCQWSVGNADFYLKCLMAIDSEIVDREIPRTPEEANVITFYKDSIREHAVNSLVESWYLLLKEHSNKNPEITCQTLEVIGAYISWIEINLIVNNRFLEFFSYGLNQVDLRETTCSCLEEILNKGMEIGPKHKLIEYLWDNLLFTSAMSLEQQINLSNDEQDNCDYLLKFGKLMNSIGENLFTGWQKKNQQKQLDAAHELFISLEKKLPYALVLLNHSDDDISESVTEYCMHYISILKTNKLKHLEQKTHIENIFNIVINKTKYDSSFNFDNEGEDEAMFLEYRKNVKLVFDSIAQLDNDFVLTTVKNLVVNVANSWQMKSYIEIENALYLLYNLAESIPVNCVLF
jgi:exportin-T